MSKNTDSDFYYSVCGTYKVLTGIGPVTTEHTCGSLTTRVTTRTVATELKSGTIVTAPEGSATYIDEQADGNFLVQNLADSTVAVTVTVGELTQVVEPGEEVEAAPYNFSGFFEPVNNDPTLNSVKAGQAIPVKFSLAGDQGLEIFASGYPQSTQIGCDSGDTIDPIETTVTAGSSSLSYDAKTTSTPTSGKRTMPGPVPAAS